MGLKARTCMLTLYQPSALSLHGHSAIQTCGGDLSKQLQDRWQSASLRALTKEDSGHQPCRASIGAELCPMLQPGWCAWSFLDYCAQAGSPDRHQLVCTSKTCPASTSGALLTHLCHKCLQM